MKLISGIPASEYFKRYREEHKDEIAETQKRYYEDHKDEIAETKKRYYEEHKDEIKRYREEHKDEIKRYYKDRQTMSKSRNNLLKQLTPEELLKQVGYYGVNKKQEVSADSSRD